MFHPSKLLPIAAGLCPAVLCGQMLVDGSNYPGLFAPDGNVTVTPPPAGVLDLVIGGTASGALGTYWHVDASGGARLAAAGITLAQTGAQVALDGGALEFNISNSPTSILGAAGIGAGLGVSWSATAVFDSVGNELLLAPDTTYQVTFDVDGSNGLLNSTLGLTPSFGIEMLDGGGSAIAAEGGGTLVNILGIELLGIVGSPPQSGRAVVRFQTGSSVPSGPAGVRLTGSALLPATALGLGTNFATVSNLGIAVVPEPSAALLAAAGGVLLLRRRR